MSHDEEDGTTRAARARLGSVLRSKWRLDTLLGTGGMAAVYAATHRNGSRAAVKLLHGAIASDNEVRRRFLREGYVANSIEHAGVVRVLDDDVADDGAAFIVMELLEGETLSARSERLGGTLPPDQVLFVADQLLDVLAIAHAKGVVHRDLKPENVFIVNGGGVKLLDFGIARAREVAQEIRVATTVGAMMGTPAYMSPEQALGHSDRIDAQSDLWAVGATMFTMLTGKLVHEAQTVNELLIMTAVKPARSLASVAPHLAGPVAEIVDRALAFEKPARWPDARSMQRAVRNALAGIPEAGELREPAEDSRGYRGASVPRSSPARHSLVAADPAALREPRGLEAIVATVPPTHRTTTTRPRSRFVRAGVWAGALLAGLVVVVSVLGRRRASTIGAASAAPVAEPTSIAPIVAPSAPLPEVGVAREAPSAAGSIAPPAPPIATARAVASTPVATIARPLPRALPPPHAPPASKPRTEDDLLGRQH